ncbi:MAG: hypothetical protein KJS92_00375 [Bacteroidetes bacterium]|nr:hypothetical protein [Bacteroidota bacterium]
MKRTETDKADSNAAPQPAPNGKKGIRGFYEKYVDYIDSILGLLAVWLTLLIFVQLGSNLPELRWPLFLDEILFFCLIYLLIFITIKKLRPLVFVFILVGSVYLFSQIVLDVYQDSIDKTKTTQNQNINIEGGGFIHALLGPQNNANRSSGLDSLNQRNELLLQRLNRLERSHDSLLKIYQKEKSTTQ